MYGGALILYGKVSMIVGQFVNVSFVSKCLLFWWHRLCQIILRTEGSLSFLEKEDYGCRALALVDTVPLLPLLPLAWVNGSISSLLWHIQGTAIQASLPHPSPCHAIPHHLSSKYLRKLRSDFIAV